ncbi:unnamed protein product [Ambrosiozyma monospora]|uniref:Unnamed protein product n=1 Tax=Ambrosiozyma monospora TaxID=43982 RepID=A0ACB5TMH4_AMBMO|nr:unnamed protein product [Ambrosiozyma monospora]
MLKCADSKPAAVEHLSAIAKSGCYKLTKGLRTRTAKSIGDMWSRLGREPTEGEVFDYGVTNFDGFQRYLYSDLHYGLITELLLCCMQKNEVCREICCNMFWCIIISEWINRNTMYDLERVVISSFYEIFFHRQRYSPDSPEINNFASIMKGHMTCAPEHPAHQPVLQFINTMFEFLSTAAEMKTIPEGEEFEDDRTFYKINVSGYLMNVDKPELLQSFISSMYDRYLDKKNYTQAALSLELLANTYSWNPTTFLPPCEAPRFPSQSEFKRKEALFRLIAANYCKGNKVDQAVETYQELLDAYNKFNFDLKGLSYCHTELAKSFTLLETSGRFAIRTYYFN